MDEKEPTGGEQLGQEGTTEQAVEQAGSREQEEGLHTIWVDTRTLTPEARDALVQGGYGDPSGITEGGLQSWAYQKEGEIIIPEEVKPFQIGEPGFLPQKQDPKFKEEWNENPDKFDADKIIRGENE